MCFVGHAQHKKKKKRERERKKRVKSILKDQILHKSAFLMSFGKKTIRSGNTSLELIPTWPEGEWPEDLARR